MRRIVSAILLMFILFSYLRIAVYDNPMISSGSMILPSSPANKVLFLSAGAVLRKRNGTMVLFRAEGMSLAFLINSAVRYETLSPVVPYIPY